MVANRFSLVPDRGRDRCGKRSSPFLHRSAGDLPVKIVFTASFVARTRRINIEVRSLIGLALDPAAASSILGIEERTPNVPFVLRDVLGAAIERMEKPETFFPDINIAGLQQNWSILVERLREVFIPLDEVLREMEDERRDADRRLVDRDTTLERYREAYSGLQDILTGLYVLGGQRELARRLRAAVSRRNRSAGNAKPSPPEGLPLPGPFNEDDPLVADSVPDAGEPVEGAPFPAA